MFDFVLYAVSVAVLAGLYWLYRNPEKDIVLKKVKSTLKIKRFLFRRARNKPSSGTFSIDSSPEEFSDIPEAYKLLREEGFTGASVMVAIDFSASNEWQGKVTHNRKCLHTLGHNKSANPYQKLLLSMGRTLAGICGGKPLSACGFGGLHSNLFPLHASSNGQSETMSSLSSGEPTEALLSTFAGVLAAYETRAESGDLGEGSGYSDVILAAVEKVKRESEYGLLLIVGDCRMQDEGEVQATQAAIVEASHHPLSIVIVGIGDGPFTLMSHFDEVNSRQVFDNVHFVNFQRLLNVGKGKVSDSALGIQLLAELPRQYRTIKELGYLSPGTDTPSVPSGGPLNEPRSTLTDLFSGSCTLDAFD